MPHAAEQPDQRIALVQAMAGSHLGMALLDRTINQQAAMIAYLNDFKLMFVATLRRDHTFIVPVRTKRSCHDTASASRCGVCLPKLSCDARSK